MATEMQKIPSGYKQTEVGVIPEDWDVKKLDDIVSIDPDNLGSNTSPDYSFKYIALEDVSAGRLKDHSEKVFHTAPSRARRKIKKGDILFGTVRPNLRSHLFFNEDGSNWICSTGFTVMRCREGVSNPGYVFAHIFANTINRQIDALLTGSNYPAVNSREVRNLMIQVPSYPEQTVIATTLSDTDALIERLDRLIKKKKNIKQGAMRELLTGKRRLPGFGGKWEVINMAEKSTLKARIGWQGLTTAEYHKTGDYYLVTGTDFIGGKVNWGSCHFVDKNRYAQDKNIQLAKGDILITKDGTIGKVGFVDFLPGPATLNSGVFVIRPQEKAYHSLFLFYILTSFLFDIFLAKLQAGSTISHLYQKDFISFCFSAPEIEEQVAIAMTLSDMDMEIEQLESQLAKYQNIKQGMMQTLLTGKIRLI